MDHVMDEELEELEQKLRQFKNGDIGGLNLPIRLDNGITICLAHWVQSHNQLTITIAIPPQCPQPDEEQPLSELGDQFASVIADFNTVLDKNGYDTVTEYACTSNDTGPLNARTYKFNGIIPNLSK